MLTYKYTVTCTRNGKEQMQVCMHEKIIFYVHMESVKLISILCSVFFFVPVNIYCVFSHFLNHGH